MAAYTSLHFVLRLMPISFQVRAFLVVGSVLLLLRLTTAAVTGSIDCALRLALRFIPTPFLRRGVGRVVCACGCKLSLTAPFPLFAATPPMSGCWHASLRCQPGNFRLPFRLVRTGICTPFSLSTSGRFAPQRIGASRHSPPSSHP